MTNDTCGPKARDVILPITGILFTCDKSNCLNGTYSLILTKISRTNRQWKQTNYENMNLSYCIYAVLGKFWPEIELTTLWEGTEFGHTFTFYLSIPNLSICTSPWNKRKFGSSEDGRTKKFCVDLLLQASCSTYDLFRETAFSAS